MVFLLILVEVLANGARTCIVRVRFVIAPRRCRRKTLQREFGEVVTASSSTGVFAISVAAEMASMEIQNLRVYERRGLIEPDRTAGGTRLYSPQDIERLVRIRELLAEGLNLAGISRVLVLETEVTRLRAANARLRQGFRSPSSSRPDETDDDLGSEVPAPR
jgi:MerR family transcriptional regulator/heat shock protein HspR